MIAGVSAAAAVAVLADGDDALGAGFVAFVVVVALCVASYLLFRSMNKHLKGLPAHFPPGGEAGDPAPPPAGSTPSEGEREHEG